MRVIVFFDLPVLTTEERRTAAKFRKYLVKSGFMMMQESVYCKLALNAVAVNAICQNVRCNSPDKGLVQMLSVTEKQFNNIEYIVGQGSSEVINSTDRMVVL